MPTDQETVETGLGEVVPTAQTPAPKPLVSGNFGEDVTAKVTEINQPAVVAATVAATPDQPFSTAEQAQAENENLHRDFVAKLHAANNPPPVEYKPPPIPERIAEQTRLEMEAGRKRVAEFAEQQASRPKPAPDKTEGSTVAVFRPEDYVPSQRKGQGHVNAKTL